MEQIKKAEWRQYEEFVFEKLSEEFPDCRIRFDQKVVGLYSGVKRQVDILIEGNLGGHPILGAVECKCFNNNLDIKDVDSFVGFLEDINANLGIMISKTGYSKAAKKRTFGTKIKLEIINWEELPEYYIDWQYCICEPDNSKEWNLTDWALPREGKTKYQQVDIGQCKYCCSTNIRCKSCEEVLFFPEGSTHTEECACGLQIQVMTNTAKNKLFDPKIILKSTQKIVSNN